MIKTFLLFLIILKQFWSDKNCKTNDHFDKLIKNRYYFKPIEIETEDNYILKVFRVKKTKKQ